MDLRVKKYVESLEEYTLIEEQSPQVPMNVRVNNPVLGRTTIIAVSHVEPVDQVLPINVLWACFDRASIMYRRLFKRVSRDPDPVFGTQHTWEPIQDFNSIWDYIQYYLPGEEPDYSKLPIATVGQIGTVTISVASADEEDPVAVSYTDPRNTDARVPLPHEEMHPEKPLRQVRTTVNPVTVENTVTGADGMPITAMSSAQSTYRRLRESQVHQNNPQFVSGSNSNPPATVTRVQIYMHQVTLDEMVNGVNSGKSVGIFVAAYNQSQPGDWIFRLFAGYYVPVMVRVNGAQITGNTVTVVNPGTYQIEADVSVGGQTMTVHGTLTCV